ncbi:MAG: shikimate dehydrogenase [Rhizobiaceae bacterium]|mgnify:FL=1|nr:shikimate dehydrogenase [Rhizobiaceae bacterium]|tara:strand:+ start:39105 stop:39923 length:819 start_codon:yes stop_codon:yes gene_type:complete
MHDAPSIDGNTKIMGLIGSPVTQVKTPQAINPIFAEAGANILCVPIHVDDLETAMAGFRAMHNLIGFGVTLPHKQQIASLCDSLDPAAEQVEAVNVVRRERDGSFRGYQFDGRGFVGGLMAQGHDPKGRSVLVIGAGGASAAIVTALIMAGASEVGISNRTTSRAEALAQQVRARIGGNVHACDPMPKPGQMIVNATSLGMDEADALPLDPALLDESMLVAEVIAKPAITALLEQARQRGATIHGGQHMIEGQVPMIAAHFLALYGPDQIKA